MLTVRDAAKRLGFSENALRVLVARRQIRHLRRSRRGRIFFLPEWLDEYIAEHAAEVQPEGRPPARLPKTYAQLSTPGFFWHLMGGSRSRRDRSN